MARVKLVLNDFTLANDLDCQFEDVAVGLGKMPLNAIHGRRWRLIWSTFEWP